MPILVVRCWDFHTVTSIMQQNGLGKLKKSVSGKGKSHSRLFERETSMDIDCQRREAQVQAEQREKAVCV